MTFAHLPGFRGKIIFYITVHKYDLRVHLKDDIINDILFLNYNIKYYNLKNSEAERELKIFVWSWSRSWSQKYFTLGAGAWGQKGPSSNTLVLEDDLT